MATDRVLAILLDGVRYDYLNPTDTPFLYQLSQDAHVVAGLRKSAPFCERSELISGKPAGQTSYFAAFERNLVGSPYAGLARFPSVAAAADYFGYKLPLQVPRSLGSLVYRVHRRLRNAAARRMARRRCQALYEVNDIPSKLLPEFSLTEDGFVHDAPEAFDSDSLFNDLRKCGRTWVNRFDTLRVGPEESPTGLDEHLLGAIDGSDALLLYADSSVDAITHIEGTQGEARRQAMATLDAKVAAAVTRFLHRTPGGAVVLFSPHGMMDVSEQLDVEAVLNEVIKAKGVAVPGDLVYFLDSTMVRLWGPARKQVRSHLEQSLHRAWGRWLDRDTLWGRHSNMEVWWAEPGVVVFPDFFRRFSPPQGMHGYDPDHTEMDGFAIVSGPGVHPGHVPLRPLYGFRATINLLLECAPEPPDQQIAWMPAPDPLKRNDP